MIFLNTCANVNLKFSRTSYVKAYIVFSQVFVTSPTLCTNAPQIYFVKYLVKGRRNKNLNIKINYFFTLGTPSVQFVVKKLTVLCHN